MGTSLAGDDTLASALQLHGLRALHAESNAFASAVMYPCWALTPYCLGP